MDASDPTGARPEPQGRRTSAPAAEPSGAAGGAARDRAWWTLHLWQIQGVRDALVIAAAIGLVWLGYAMRSVTTPLLVALGLAYLFEPVIVWVMRRWGLSRTTVVSSLLLLLVGGVILTAVLTAPLVIRQTGSLVEDVRSGRLVRGVERLESLLPERARQPFHDFASRLGLVDQANQTEPDPAAKAVPLDEAGEVGTHSPVAGEQAGQARDTPAKESLVKEDETERIRRIVRQELLAMPPPESFATTASGRMNASSVVAVLRSGWDTVEAVLGFLLKVGLLTFLIPFYFFFFSVSYPAVQRFCESLIPHSNRDRALDLLRQMDAAVAGFVRGRVVISAIVGFVLASGWLIVGVPYSIVLGIVVGVFNLVPYLSGVGLPVAVGLMVFHQLGLPEADRSWAWAILAPTAVFFAAQLLDGYVLTPVIAGKATNLDPVTIFVAVLAGGSLGGVYGMLLAIPVAACLKIAMREVLLPRIKQWVEGRAKDPLPM